jgi:hypothetical protein
MKDAFYAKFSGHFFTHVSPASQLDDCWKKMPESSGG